MISSDDLDSAPCAASTDERKSDNHATMHKSWVIVQHYYGATQFIWQFHNSIFYHPLRSHYGDFTIYIKAFFSHKKKSNAPSHEAEKIYRRQSKGGNWTGKMNEKNRAAHEEIEELEVNWKQYWGHCLIVWSWDIVPSDDAFFGCANSLSLYLFAGICVSNVVFHRNGNCIFLSFFHTFRGIPRDDADRWDIARNVQWNVSRVEEKFHIFEWTIHF